MTLIDVTRQPEPPTSARHHVYDCGSFVRLLDINDAVKRLQDEGVETVIHEHGNHKECATYFSCEAVVKDWYDNDPEVCNIRQTIVIV